MKIFDIVVSSFLLLIFSPLILIITILCKVTNGSVFYKQERLGKDSKEFILYKFKTMKDKEDIPVIARDDDERFDKISNWLRGGLDEIPQLWNVIKGDMSLVGPRPERKVFSDKFANMYDNWNKRVEVMQGITGLAQINNAGSLEPLRKMSYDLEYIRNKSFLLDVKILGKTGVILIRNYIRKIFK